MENNVEISVIVPIHNNGPFLEKCLDSLRNQTFPRMEFILVDDGSTDNSSEIIKDFAQKDSRFHAFKQPQSGVSAARNFGLCKACGKYIGFVDGDDWIEPEMYEKLWKNIILTGVDFVTSPYQLEFSNPSRVEKRDHSVFSQLLQNTSNRLKGAEDLLFDDGSVCNKLFSREFIEKNNLKFNPDIQMGEDALFYWKSAVIAEKLGSCPHIFYHYRKSIENSASSLHGESIMSMLNAYDDMELFMQQNNKEEYRPWLNHLKISFTCFCYAKLTQELKKKFFNEICTMIKRNDFYSNEIAYPRLIGRFAYDARYAVLHILHPITLFALHHHNKSKRLAFPILSESCSPCIFSR